MKYFVDFGLDDRKEITRKSAIEYLKGRYTDPTEALAAIETQPLKDRNTLGIGFGYIEVIH
ncbi:hypothetical protein LCGC14_2563250 [marine sediment metagenome]|uniref:Uncharacterized protein n=1 Tax=marine sediment metagenome TaxID=412755 RepID=A0A0F9B7F1_9ZZZZ